jgi:hypothetical protein
MQNGDVRYRRTADPYHFSLKMRIRIRVLTFMLIPIQFFTLKYADPDLDQASQTNGDPCRSGSATLPYRYPPKPRSGLILSSRKGTRPA